MNKKIIIFFICILLLSIVFLYVRSKENKVNDDSQTSEIPAPQYPVIPTPDDFYHYENVRLGFSLSIPKEADCQENKVCPIKVYENGKDPIVYVNREYDFQYPDTSTTTYERLKDNPNIISGWKILFQKVNSQKEAIDFLKKQYGNGCKVQSMKESLQKGVYDVVLEGTAFEIPVDQQCILNFLYQIRYFPERHILATWVMGQEARFVLGQKSDFDPIMADSFKFLK